MCGVHGRSQAVPAFLEGVGQDRARGRHLTATNTLSAFGRFNQLGGGVGEIKLGREGLLKLVS